MLRELILGGVIAALSAPAFAAVAGPGDIAFTGYNADGQDDFAFVTLKPISVGETIYFTDNEWNGSAIGSGGAFNTGESYTSWTAGSNLAAGSVVTINNVSNAAPPISANTGTAAGVTVANSANRGFSTSAEAVYAYLASSATPDAPTAFLAMITTDTDANATVTGTGLAYGSTAIALSSSSDGAVYTGSRSDLASVSGYAAPVNTIGNWNDIANGDGTSLLPFDSTAFSTSVPEPTALAAVGLIGAAALGRRRRA